jgi:UDP-N-acetylmuramoylalanine--D-glutamate ligase
MELSFAGKQVVILGLARQGQALARFFTQAGAQVTVSDAAPADALRAELAALGELPAKLALGGHPLSLLDSCDLLCLSGGVPPQIELVQAAVQRGIPLSNDSLLTLQQAAARGLGPVVAITGSSGKTTTTTLVGEMLAASGRTVHVGGNIGTPLLDRLDAVAPGDCIVLELSSFQLELFDPAIAYGPFDRLGPDVAAILNVTPNHLDRHPDMAAYAAAKFNLLRHLPPAAAVVLNADDAVTGALARASHPQVEPPAVPEAWRLTASLEAAAAALSGLQAPAIPFSRTQPLARGAWLDGEVLTLDGQPICRRDEVRLRGDHNVSNLLAAAAISGAAGAHLAGMAAVARTFAGVPHRLEVVASQGGVTWINDSIATSPERAVAGLRSFGVGEQTLVLLAGGKDKNLPWETFADEVLRRVDVLIGFGHAGPMIVNAVQQRAEYQRATAPNCAVVQRLDEAADLAARVAATQPSALSCNGTSAANGQAHKPTVILLSPGGTSYDAYKNFEERGEHFRRLALGTMAATAGSVPKVRSDSLAQPERRQP